MHVPHIILDNWEIFCKELMSKYLFSWSEEEIEDGINVLKWHRKDLIDAPTPREIKTYINQIGVLRAGVTNDISVHAICCFVYQKYLVNSSLVEIEQGLIAGSFPNEKIKNLIGNEKVEDEISALLLNLQKEKAIQVLLAKPIGKAFDNKDEKRIIELYNTHKSSFWFVTKKILSDKTENQLISGSYIVKHILMKLNRLECQFFITKLTNEIPTWREISFPDKNGFMHDKDEYFALRDLVYESGGPYLKLCELMGESFIKQNFDENDSGFSLMIFKEFTKLLPNNSNFTINTSGFTYDKWERIAEHSAKSNTYLTSIIKMPSSMQNQIETEIKSLNLSKNSIIHVIRYAIRCIKDNWEEILITIQKYSGDWEPGSGLDYTYILLIDELYYADNATKKMLKEIIGSRRYWRYIATFIGNKNIEDIAAINLGRYYSDFSIIGNNFTNLNVMNSLNTAKNWWTKQNANKAQLIFNKSKENNDYGYIWDLAKTSTNLLIGQIIAIAIRDEDNSFLNHNNCIENYLNAFEFYGDYDAREFMAKAFCKLTDIENKIIIDKVEVNLKNVLRYEMLLEVSNNKEFISYLRPKTNNIR